jgi:hypothetical protein
VQTVRDIRTATDVDFGLPEKFPHYWAELLADDELAIRVLTAAITPQAQVRQIDVADFAAHLDGTIIEEGLTALAAAVVLFTRPQKRGLVSDGLEVVNAHWRKAVGDSRAAIRDYTTAAAEKALAQLGT